jgi:four helix bundle protein
MGKFKDQRSKTKEGSNSKDQPSAASGLYAGWDDVDEESVVKEEGKGGNGRAFDLEERTAVFGEKIVRFGKRIPRNPGNDRLIGQIVGAGTSVGANYIEASESVSKKDFKFSISRCKKESEESRFYLRMIAASEPRLAEDCRILYREANELLLIFAEIHRK